MFDEISKRVEAELRAYRERMKIAHLFEKDKVRYELWKETKNMIVELDKIEGQLLSKVDEKGLQLARKTAITSIDYCKVQMPKLIPRKLIDRYSMIKPLDNAASTISDLGQDQDQ